jgi:predicted NUDIX family NTP pyrophosphohydrolase
MPCQACHRYAFRSKTAETVATKIAAIGEDDYTARTIRSGDHGESADDAPNQCRFADVSHPRWQLRVLLAHPGGPRFEKKDEKAWSIPKGELEPGEDLFETA